MKFTEYFSLFSLVQAFCVFISIFFVYGTYDGKKQNEKHSRHKWYASLFDGPKPVPYFGNSLNFILHPESIALMLMFYTQKYGSKYRLWIGQKLSIVISDASDAKTILIGNKFTSKGDDFHDLFGRVFKTGTFSDQGESWKKSRKILQQPFKSILLHNYIDTMNEEARKIVKELQPKAHNPEMFDVSDFVGTATFNIACKTLFDLKEPVSKETHYIFRKAAEEFETDSFNLMFYPKLIRNIKQLFAKKKLNHIFNIMELPYRKVILEGKLKVKRDKKNDEQVDKKLIDYLKSDVFSDEEKKAQIMTYSVGGSETLVISISLTLLILAIYHEIQDKVVDELKHIFNDDDRDTTVDDIKQMHYLEQVLKEVMRLFPLAPFLFRTAKEDVILGNHTIPSGTEFIINVPALHNNPTNFPNPDTFDPEHFSAERCRVLPKGSYLPFAIGPRNCIGKAFAMYEMKIVCSAILRKYRLHSIITKEDIKVKYSFVLDSIEGYNISLSERK
uniref:Cytochrome P450 3639B1 n=1 Tax=Maconellicoccus hirsutus TaxID=177089 RepID=A0AAT9UUW7_MACHI